MSFNLNILDSKNLSKDSLFSVAVFTLMFVSPHMKREEYLLQSELKIGFNRASNLLDEMENLKIVGPRQSDGSRIVLLKNLDTLYGDGASADIITQLWNKDWGDDEIDINLYEL